MGEILTVDRKMKELIQLARTVAPSKATVLIQGESGTGKELVASLIHQNSNRAGKPFVAINCAAIPDNLLESELFGYERGAFTGAINSKGGKFELANGGTLLLDEISEMDFRLQAKLLRVIQEGEVDRLGGRRPIPVDVRLIATSNRNLADSVKNGLFREDLFYRLNVVNLTLPSLRERIGDVKLLSNAFLRNYGEKNNKPVLGLSPEALAKLESHSWPGNVRELENVIERAMITMAGPVVTEANICIDRTPLTRTPAMAQATGQMGVQQIGSLQAKAPHDALGNPALSLDDGSEQAGWIPGTTLDDIERNVILTALKYHQHNRTHTARALGISIRTLRNKISDYRKSGIPVI